MKDNFFEFGGHSLKAIALALRIFKEMKVNIAAADIFMRPTSREISQYIIQSNNSAEIIKKVQPQGPYYIAGWSCGGIIAFEIIRQIEETNDKIEFLGIIDSVLPKKGSNLYSRGFNIETEKQFLRKAAERSSVCVDIENLKSVEEMYNLVLNYIGEINFNIDPEYREIINNIFPEYDKMHLKDLIRNINVIRSISQICMHYTPKSSIKTHIHYFKAEKSFEIDEKV